MTTPINFPVSPPDDGDFSHPALNGFNNGQNSTENSDPTSRDATNYDIRGMAKQLYNEAGLEWPDWVDDPSKNDEGETNEQLPNNANTQQPPQSQSTEPPSTVVKIGNREIPIAQGEALLQWQEWLTQNPDKAQTIVKIVRGEQPIPAPPTMFDRSQQPPPQQQQPPPPVETQPLIQPPEGFDLSTPRDKFIFDQLNKSAENNTRLMAALDQQQQAIKTAEIGQRAREDTSYAINQFKTKHKFSDEEVEAVRQIASDLNLVGGLVAKDPANAPAQIVKALEAAMWQHEPIRAKLLNQPAPQPTDTEKTRQQKLNALSGSTGSTPRTESRPRLDTDSDMKDAIARAIESIASN